MLQRVITQGNVAGGIRHQLLKHPAQLIAEAFLPPQNIEDVVGKCELLGAGERIGFTWIRDVGRESR